MDIFHQEANAPIEQAPLDVAPPSPVKSDWSAMNPGVAQDAKLRQDRRSSIAAAVSKVESGWKRPQHQTKAERLSQPASKGDRDTDTGGLKARRAVTSAVQRAIEKVAGIASDKELNQPETRKDREAFKTRYPNAKLSELFERSEKWDADFKKDPVGTRERILQTYAGVSPQNFKEVVEHEKAPGVRGSIQQAQRDQADLENLKPHMAKWGKNFPHILSQLQKFDADMIADPAGTSARLAAGYGAPVTESQIESYKQKRAAEEHRAQDSANVHKALEFAIQRNVLPGMENEAVQNAIADVLESKSFARTGNRLEDLQRAHAQVMQRRAAPAQNDRGSRSISGGSPTASHDSTRSSVRPASGARAAVQRAFGK